MILIINNSKKEALLLSEAFYYMGVLSRGVTPPEAYAEVSDIYKAIIIVKPERIANKDLFIASIRECTSSPIFGVVDSYVATDRYLFDGCLSGEFYCSKIYEYIIKHFNEKRSSPPGIYIYRSFNASSVLGAPRYKSITLPFTKSETMILRTLIKLSPDPVCAKDILKYAFRESRSPEISNVRTQISIMNKKFKFEVGERLIDFSYNSGYKIRTEDFAEIK